MRLRDLLWALSRKRERQTDRDGFLSYAGEFHALTLGLAYGLFAGYQGQPAIAVGVIGVALGLKPGAYLGKIAKDATLKRLGKTAEKASLLGELRREPWYSSGGVLLAYTAGGTLRGLPVQATVSELVGVFGVLA
jgi:hypothetical protein